MLTWLWLEVGHLRCAVMTGVHGQDHIKSGVGVYLPSQEGKSTLTQRNRLAWDQRATLDLAH